MLHDSDSSNLTTPTNKSMTTLPKNWFSSSLLWNWLQRLALKGVPSQVWWEQSIPARLQHTLEKWGATSLVGRLVEPLGLLVLCLVLVVSPFVSTTTVGILLVAELGVWVLLVLKPRSCPTVALPVLAFWLAGSVSLASSQWFATSLDGWIKLTLYMAGFALGAHLLQRATYRTAAIATYLLVSLPVSGYGLWQWVYGAQALATWVDQDSTLAETTRVYSFLGNPNLLAGYLLPAIPLGIAGCLVWQSWGAKLVSALAGLAALLCLVLTFSRGGWIALAVMALVLGVLLVQWITDRLPVQARRRLVPSLFAGAVLGLVVLFWRVPVLGDRIGSIFAWRDDSSNNFRINVWTSVLDMIRDFPLTGIGPGNQTFEAAYPFYQQPKFDALGAYSVPLEITVELGVLGALCFAWLVLVLLVQGFTTWNTRRQSEPSTALWSAAATVAVVGLLVHGLVDTVWFRPPIQVLWWLMCAVIAAEGIRAGYQTQDSAGKLVAETD